LLFPGEVLPGDDFKLTLRVFGQCRAAFDPIAIIAIKDAVYVSDLGVMDVAADNAIDAALAGGAGDGLFIVGDIFNGVFDPGFEISRQRPIRTAKGAADDMEPIVERQRHAVGLIAQPGKPPGVGHNRVKLVAMKDQKLPAIGGLMDGFAHDLDAGQIEIGIVAQGFIMVAGDIDDLCAFSGAAQNFLDNQVVVGAPIPRAFDPPAVNNVADQIDGFRLVVVEKVDQQAGLAPRRSQMNVRQEQGAMACGIFSRPADLPLVLADAFTDLSGGG